MIMEVATNDLSFRFVITRHCGRLGSRAVLKKGPRIGVIFLAWYVDSIVNDSRLFQLVRFSNVHQSDTPTLYQGNQLVCLHVALLALVARITATGQANLFLSLQADLNRQTQRYLLGITVPRYANSDGVKESATRRLTPVVGKRVTRERNSRVGRDLRQHAAGS